MTGPEPTSNGLPDDPTFPPAAYARLAALLRTGVIGFLLLASAGLLDYLRVHPAQTVNGLLASGAGSLAWGNFVHGVGTLDPSDLILLGIYVLIGVTIGRVGLAAIDLALGRERALAAVTAGVVILLLVGLFVVAPFVR